VGKVERCFGCMTEKTTTGACPCCGYVESAGLASVLHLRPGTILQDKYLIGRALGQGGFGITYLAWDLNLNIKLAIKEFMPQNLATRVSGNDRVITFKETLSDQFHYGLDKFLQEARTLAQFIELPNVAAVRDYFLANGTAYLVMNYLEGVTLRDYLRLAERPVTYAEALNMFLPLMGALSVMHDRGVLHRDISPDNILIDGRGNLTLIDFGSARQAVGGWQDNLSVVMKPGFSPEEQHRKTGVQGPWTDIYALAATLYWLITGQKPADSLDRLVEDTLLPPSSYGASIGRAEEDALLKALEVKSENRYQSIMDFQAELVGNVIEKKQVEAPVVAENIAKEVNKGNNMARVALMIAALALFAAAYQLWPSESREVAEDLTPAGEIVEEAAATEIDQGSTAAGSGNPNQPNVLTPPQDNQPDAKQFKVPGDYPTIQGAIDAASSGAIIVVEPGTYSENIDFKGKAVSLVSNDPTDPDIVATTVIDGGGRGSTVSFRSGETSKSVLSGFTIRGGSGTIDNYTITSYDGEKLSFRRRYGGGILISGRSSPTITFNVITGNKVKRINSQNIGVGGGVAILDNSSPLLEHNNIKDNHAEGYGGGVAVWYRSSPVIRNNNIYGNNADQIGGGIMVAMMCSPELYNNYFLRNSSDRSGGLYIAHMSAARVMDNNFEENFANLGGGIFIWRTEDVQVRDNHFSSNWVNQHGAAIYMGNRASARLTNNSFEGNVASGKGAAVWISKDSEATDANNDFYNNNPDNIFQE
jgi:parallel beta-helix repeat protein